MNNSDKKFADCTKSQEMSNEEINEELGIGQDEADAYDCDAAKRGKEKEQKSKRLTGAYNSVWGNLESTHPWLECLHCHMIFHLLIFFILFSCP